MANLDNLVAELLQLEACLAYQERVAEAERVAKAEAERQFLAETVNADG